ncbi:hypothetical protein FGADI_11338 [Fusarium gaditjirri]|uniref:Vegetative incompatibility protein HET-E-1 n=1 Tax=Fusarium gaditjirri TaxID=282569 RepID=A0A8H4SUS3_9HYPO|nr:hypothetical protein FGADI_11338 [Fusarium gaditjirri]
MKTRLKSPDLYTIGWIAALPIERAAATALLHDRHDVPHGFDQPRSDTNSYTWGRIGEHNVVIASLPAGDYDTTSAATTASNLIHSLSHIRIDLLVGIGGGIARLDEGQDIRLGDIVVSQPDGTTGGVVQYDLGKAKANGGWERKGFLSKPPPGTENDRLFESQHEHVGGSNCDKCNPAREVKREQRESTDPEIHYGIIASGNKLIKDAATRDSLLEGTRHQCLCVEMEAAGLMDRFPRLMIRGICDYTDSHKNDRWQRYAAATAVAFAVELLAYVPVGQLEATQKVIDAIQSLHGEVGNLKASMNNIDYHVALDHLPNAEGASFDSYAEEHNPTCLPDTREELLSEIDRWIVDPNSRTIFWLNGMAGTGKSTISRTVARSRSKKGDLGASFFFKRGETDRGSLAKFVPTVARRLASSIPEAASFIKSAVHADPVIVDKAVREQFERHMCPLLNRVEAAAAQGKTLQTEPLSKMTATSSPRSSVVVIVDALDECESDDDIKLLLELFSSLRFDGSFRVRVLITSRPELAIRLGFFFIEGTYQDLILQGIPHLIVEHDISIFLRHEFANIRNRFNRIAVEGLKLPVGWPGEANLEKLTRAAVPLFIFAATICRFVNDSCLGSPDKLLQSVLHHTSNGHASKLDMTYSPVLKQQVIGRSGRERRSIIESFRLIVGTIVTLASPLSVRALALFLDVHIDEVTTRLRMLHSVLEVPENLYTPVRLLHLSFRDYLLDPENKDTAEFWVDEKLAHRRLAKHCLRVMRSALRENMCGLSFPGAGRSTVDSSQLEEHIPPQVQYACMHWLHHLVEGDSKLKDSSDVHDFLTTHFLHWLEVLSLIGRISESIGFIDELQSIVDAEKGAQVLMFLHDAKRFVLNYRWIIDTAPLQLYASAIVFTPKQSIVRQTFKRDLPEWISLLPNVDSDWNAVLQTLEGHTTSVESVVFSKDGTLTASGSWDETVKIWNVVTGKEERTLKGYTNPVNSVVFSKGGTLIASGSDDKTIKIWNVVTGKEERTLEDHTESVTSVTFSNDSTLIASGSRDNTVKIWNVAMGKEEWTLEGHTASVNSLVFSKDGTLIASGSWDEKVKIWNVVTGLNVKSFDTSQFTDVLFFTDDGSVLVTSTGRFSIDFRDISTSHRSENEPKLGSTEVEGEVDAKLGFGINHDNTWITAGGPDGRNVLWLPPNFRPRVSATLIEPLGSVLVISCPSGAVIIMGFRELPFSDKV